MAAIQICLPAAVFSPSETSPMLFLQSAVSLLTDLINILLPNSSFSFTHVVLLHFCHFSILSNFGVVEVVQFKFLEQAVGIDERESGQGFACFPSFPIMASTFLEKSICNYSSSSCEFLRVSFFDRSIDCKVHLFFSGVFSIS